jgi:hypothetical protein
MPVISTTRADEYLVRWPDATPDETVTVDARLTYPEAVAEIERRHGRRTHDVRYRRTRTVEKGSKR